MSGSGRRPAGTPYPWPRRTRPGTVSGAGTAPRIRARAPAVPDGSGRHRQNSRGPVRRRARCARASSPYRSPASRPPAPCWTRRGLRGGIASGAARPRSRRGPLPAPPFGPWKVRPRAPPRTPPARSAASPSGRPPGGGRAAGAVHTGPPAPGALVARCRYDPSPRRGRSAPARGCRHVRTGSRRPARTPPRAPPPAAGSARSSA